MKLKLLAILTLLPSLAIAQSTSDSTPPPGVGGQWHHQGGNPDAELARLTAKLTLTSDEQSEIKPVLVSKDEQMKNIFANTSLTPAEKQEQMKTLSDSSKQKIESYLTPAQVTLFESMHDHKQHGPPPSA